jgi:phage baseplate assembly protein gpV
MFRTTNDFLQGAEKYDQGTYIGVVFANNDPLGIGRVQANVPGLYDTTLGAVPWIGPKKDSPFGYGTGTKGKYGVYGVPQVGSKIIVELQQGDEHKPLYSTFPTAQDANPTFASPTVWGYQDPDGNIMIYNMASHTYTFITAGGYQIQIDASGNRITTVANDTENASGNWTINVAGNAQINADGNVGLKAGGTATYQASSHSFIGPVTASATISAAGDITDDTASGNGQTMADMRTYYNEHYHTVEVEGNEEDTSVPIPQIP